MLTIFLDMRESITIDFLEKSATVNSASYYQNSPYLLNEPCILNLINLNIPKTIKVCAIKSREKAQINFFLTFVL